MSKSSPWIVNKGYDVAFIFGGAGASLLVPLLVMWHPEWLAAMFWIWLILFDGTHLWASYSRTYIDRDFWRSDRRLLAWSLLVFIAPLFAVGLMWLLGSQTPVQFFLMFALAWAYYHIFRQHYGYVSIYDRKANTDQRAHNVNKWTLYIGLLAPYGYFILNHPINREMAGLTFLENAVWLGWLTVALPVTASVGALLYFVICHLSYRGEEGRVSGPAVFFVLTCLGVYSLIFYVIAPGEPFFPGARSPVQKFMVIAMMMSLFHNVQYHAIVWHHNRRKYRQDAESRNEFGMAVPLNRNIIVYLLVGVGFASLYGGIAWLTTDYPTPGGELMEQVFVPAAFCLWWGLLFHHYYLDQKIWRVSRKKDLQKHLRVDVEHS